MKTKRRLGALAPLILWGALGSPLFAQVPLFRWNNPNDSGVLNSLDAFYRQLSDVDGDGFPEILLPDTSGQPDVVLWVYSLAKQQVLFTIPTSSLTSFVSDQALITTKDLNGDGLRDIVLAVFDSFPSPPTTRIVNRAFSGLDGSLIWEVDEVAIPLIGGVANAGDVNGDGVEDVASSIRINGTVAQILSGLDGSLIQTMTSNDVFGIGELRPAGDLDGDGFGDIIDDTGNLEFFSGKDGSVLWARPRAVGDGRLRAYAIGVGDVDGDGRDDWAEGWLGDDITHPQQCFTPVIALFHGFPPVEIDRVLGQEISDPIYMGPIFHFDFDGDGTEDILYRGRFDDNGSVCSQGGFYSSYVSIYSPARKKFLFTWADAIVFPLQAVGADWDGDGLPDLLTFKSVGSTGTFRTLQVLTLRSHLSVLPKTISRAAGGTLQFSIDAGLRFANHKAMVLPGTGPEWPFFFRFYNTAGGLMEAFALPFALTKSTSKAWGNRKTAPWSSLRTTLDAQGRGTVTFTLPPNFLPGNLVGKKLFFAAELDTVKPRKPETATEAVTVTVLP